MSDLSVGLKKFATEHPELAAFLKQLLLAVMFGHSADDKAALLSTGAALLDPPEAEPFAVEEPSLEERHAAWLASQPK